MQQVLSVPDSSSADVAAGLQAAGPEVTVQSGVEQAVAAAIAHLQSSGLPAAVAVAVAHLKSDVGPAAVAAAIAQLQASISPAAVAAALAHLQPRLTAVAPAAAAGGQDEAPAPTNRPYGANQRVLSGPVLSSAANAAVCQADGVQPVCNPSAGGWGPVVPPAAGAAAIPPAAGARATVTPSAGETAAVESSAAAVPQSAGETAAVQAAGEGGKGAAAETTRGRPDDCPAAEAVLPAAVVGQGALADSSLRDPTAHQELSEQEHVPAGELSGCLGNRKFPGCDMGPPPFTYMLAHLDFLFIVCFALLILYVPNSNINECKGLSTFLSLKTQLLEQHARVGCGDIITWDVPFSKFRHYYFSVFNNVFIIMAPRASKCALPQWWHSMTGNPLKVFTCYLSPEGQEV